ncbi:MAG: integral rane sensor signal transduction histidine kinase [Rhodocyclaceae bacterium]|nr:integral rane sensor signal transduction histidine kinase [Rhodocyclaceae bacterium]
MTDPRCQAARFPLLPAWLACALLYLVFLVVAGPAAAEGVPDRLRLGTDLPLSVLEDPEGRLSLAEVAALPSERFRRLHTPFAGGFSKSAFWFRLDLPPGLGPEEERWLEVFPPILDTITLFEPTAGGWKPHLSGDLRPFSQREFAYHHFLFRIHGNNEGRPLFLRVQTHKALAVNGSLWRPEAFTQAAIRESLGAGLYFGIWAIALIIFIGYAVVFRYRTHVVLVVANTATALVVAALHGYHAQFLLPDAPAIASSSVPFLVALSMVVQVWLLRTIMYTGTRTPRLDRVLFILSLVLAASVVSEFTGHWSYVSPWITLTSPFCSVVGLVLSVQQLREKRAGARVLLVAFGIHGLMAFPVTLTILGLLPPFPLLLSGWQLELPFHILLIHAALVSRIWAREKTLRHDLEDALDASHQAEKELERRVEDRTRELAEAKHDVERALASERRSLLEQRQFMSMVSHEFRTPLAVIDSVATNLVEVPLAGEDDLAQRSRQVQRAVKRLARLVENCLADERVDGEALALQLQPASPEALVREAAEIVQWSPQHHLRLEFRGLPDHIPCDPTLVRMALSNLIDNAVKYSPGGEVTVRSWAVMDRICFSVSDHGPGIPPEAREAVFRRFARGDNIRGKPGVGLGLHVARKIAELHSGGIEIATPDGHGATFVLTLACQIQAPALAEPETA